MHVVNTGDDAVIDGNDQVTRGDAASFCNTPAAHFDDLDCVVGQQIELSYKRAGKRPSGGNNSELTSTDSWLRPPTTWLFVIA